MYKNGHNHETDVIKIPVRQVCADIKSKSTSSESTKRVITEVVGDYPNEILHKLPSTVAMVQQIRYKRRKPPEHPTGPSSTTLQHGGNFLLRGAYVLRTWLPYIYCRHRMLMTTMVFDPPIIT